MRTGEVAGPAVTMPAGIGTGTGANSVNHGLQRGIDNFGEGTSTSTSVNENLSIMSNSGMPCLFFLQVKEAVSRLPYRDVEKSELSAYTFPGRLLSEDTGRVWASREPCWNGVRLCRDVSSPRSSTSSISKTTTSLDKPTNVKGKHPSSPTLNPRISNLQIIMASVVWDFVISHGFVKPAQIILDREQRCMAQVMIQLSHIHESLQSQVSSRPPSINIGSSAWAFQVAIGLQAIRLRWFRSAIRVAVESYLEVRRKFARNGRIGDVDGGLFRREKGDGDPQRFVELVTILVAGHRNAVETALRDRFVMVGGVTVMDVHNSSSETPQPRYRVTKPSETNHNNGVREAISVGSWWWNPRNMRNLLTALDFELLVRLLEGGTGGCDTACSGEHDTTIANDDIEMLNNIAAGVKQTTIDHSKYTNTSKPIVKPCVEMLTVLINEVVKSYHAWTCTCTQCDKPKSTTKQPQSQNDVHQQEDILRIPTPTRLIPPRLNQTPPGQTGQNAQLPRGRAEICEKWRLRNVIVCGFQRALCSGGCVHEIEAFTTVLA
ncbi:hypothetical protein HDU76_013350 [Blyttiomyces sp. JEL0837]|nr:hypothetical protein HDU76_013350 [Blyttiomyces sp. JEL0837]